MDTTQQIIAKITESSSLLIVINGHNPDSLSAGLALRAFLRKLEKDAVVLSTAPVSQKLAFVPEFSEVKDRIEMVKSFVIDISTAKARIEELSYKKDQDKLSIFIKPGKGEFNPQDVSFRTSKFPYELVVLVGIPSFDQLGDFYARHTELFFDIPVANIDFRASNENYGQYNLVALSATSVSEVVLDLINKFEANLIDENIATQLLTGIVSETESFQHVRTTPQTFLKASQLISMGAKQQAIVNNLYKSKSLGLLKLWGRCLARLKFDQNLGLAYSAVNKNDIDRSFAEETDADLIIREMESQLGFAKILMFLKEDSDQATTVYIHSGLPLNLPAIFHKFNPKNIGLQTIKFSVNLSVIEAEKELVDLLAEEIGRIKPQM